MFIVCATLPRNESVFFVQDRQKLLENGKKADYGYTDKSDKALRLCKLSANVAAKYLKDCGYIRVQVIDVGDAA